MPQFSMNESSEGHDDEQPRVMQIEAAEGPIENLEETQAMNHHSKNGGHDDDDEKPWVTQATEQFLDDLDKGNYQKAWEALASSKKAEFFPDKIKEQWEEYTRNKGEVKQITASEMESEHGGSSIVYVKVEFENLEISEKIVVNFIREADEIYRVFEFNPITGEVSV